MVTFWKDKKTRSASAERVFETSALGRTRREPMNLTLSLNHRCNLRCTYCYAGEKFNRRMPLEVAEKALELAFSYPSNVVRVLLFGGEPLLELELLEAVSAATRAKAKATGKLARLGLTTNGTQLKDRALDLLDEYDFNVTVSLDGDREAHNSARVMPNGKGSFDAVVKGIRRAQERLGSVRTISVVHPGNLARLPESFDLVASLGITRMAFNLNYDAKWEEEQLEDLERGYEAMADRVIEHYRRGVDFTVQPFHAKIVSRLKGGFAPGDKCDFGCKELAVAPSGRIYPCDRLIGEDGAAQDEVVIGDVDTGVQVARVSAMKDPKDQPKADCEGCAIVDRCMWWCGCVNKALTGRVDEVSGLLCAVEQMIVRASDRIATTLFAEGNRPFFARYYLAAANAL